MSAVLDLVLGFLAHIGRATLAGLAGIGRVAIFAAGTVSHLARPPFYWREFGHALMQIGWLSLPVVGMTALFTGGALALQIYAGGARFNAETVVPSIVAIGLTRELGPVLGGLMVAARVASSASRKKRCSASGKMTEPMSRPSMIRPAKPSSLATSAWLRW